MTVTVVICTFNRVDLLKQTLVGLEKIQPMPGASWDVLIIDNASTDGTADFLRSVTAPFPVRSLHEPKPGKSNALNLALSEATADYLLFTDDDVLVEPQWLAALVDAARRHPDAAGFGGRITPWFPTDPDSDLSAAFPSLARGFCGLDRGDAEHFLEPHQDITGANMAFRRSAIDGLRFRRDLGPNQNGTIGGEELEFQSQIRARGGRFLWVPAMAVRHYVDRHRMTLPYLLKFTEDAGRREVRMLGAPRELGVGGVPLWLMRKVLDATLHTWWSRVRGQRVEALKWMRVRSENLGMVKESREQNRRSKTSAGVEAVSATANTNRKGSAT